MGGTVAFRTGEEGAGMYEELRPKLLDDRQRVPGYAQIYLGARLVGCET